MSFPQKTYVMKPSDEYVYDIYRFLRKDVDTDYLPHGWKIVHLERYDVIEEAIIRKKFSELTKEELSDWKEPGEVPYFTRHSRVWYHWNKSAKKQVVEKNIT